MASTAAAHSLMTPEAVRERAHELLGFGVAGGLNHWRVDLARLPWIADLVTDEIRERYPDLRVPFHSRWRHIGVGGIDRWGAIRMAARFPDKAAEAVAAIDLAVVSVLLDAGAGPAWEYRDAGGRAWTRSEGLAVASVDMFAAGVFSSKGAADPFRVDAQALQQLTTAALAAGFQAGAKNPLVGIDGRRDLLNRLGRIIAARPGLFGDGDAARPGGLYHHLLRRADHRRLPAREIMLSLLEGLTAIWPARLTLDGMPLGDCWRHPLVRRADATNGLIPFHKLTQWLAYSLIEPLQAAGVAVTDIDALTGLAEYRNGGLFADGGAIILNDPHEVLLAHQPGSELVVEWRALTVALLDRIAPLIRERLRLDEADFPLAKVLEGGTWWAGRRLARDKRADGGPPLAIESDGTVF